MHMKQDSFYLAGINVVPCPPVGWGGGGGGGGWRCEGKWCGSGARGVGVGGGVRGSGAEVERGVAKRCIPTYLGCGAITLT